MTTNAAETAGLLPPRRRSGGRRPPALLLLLRRGLARILICALVGILFYFIIHLFPGGRTRRRPGARFVLDDAIHIPRLKGKLAAGLSPRNTLLLPVLVWHEVGDWHGGQPNLQVEAAARLVFGKKVVVHHVAIRQNEYGARISSFKSFAYNQIHAVCHMLRIEPLFKRGVIGVGLGQGGLFLRVLQQSCENVSMHSLITIGSPHQGFSEPTSLLCDISRIVCKREWLLKHAFNPYTQLNFSPATYFKPYDRLDDYRTGSRLLGHYNFEQDKSNMSCAKMGMLHSLVLVMFANDTKLVPARSAWFDDLDASGRLVHMKDTSTYANIGLQQLDNDNRLHRVVFDGEHLQFTPQQIAELFCKYVVVAVPSASSSSSSAGSTPAAHPGQQQQQVCGYA